MSFEQYTQIYDGTDGGIVLRPKGTAATVSFPLSKKDTARYRLFTVGETAQYYMWKDEPDGPFLYRMLTDALDTAHAIRDRYCLRLSSVRPESYLRRVYKKVMWPPKLSYLSMVPVPTAWSFGVTVTTKHLSFRKDGFLRMRVDIRLTKDGVDPRSVSDTPDFSYVIPFEAGDVCGLRLSREIEIPKNTAHVCVFIEGRQYSGECYVEQPFLAADGQNLLPAFTESTPDRPHLEWAAQYLSRKEWPEFRVRLNGKVIYTGEIFERSHRYSEWELELPTALLKDENALSYELISDYHEPLPYTIYEVGVIEQPNEALSILAVSEAAPVGGYARVLVRTNRPNVRVTLTPLSDALSAKSEWVFRENGLHGILISCNQPTENAAFRLETDALSLEGTVARIVQRADDRVVTGTGDMIYVRQDLTDMEEYLSWYLSNGIGDFITIRPTYRWSGTRVLNPAVWHAFRRLMRELDLKYVLMADGREVPGLSTQPDETLLRGRGFYGVQMHERDGAQYYWGVHEAKSPTEEMEMNLLEFAYSEDPLHTSSHHSASNYRYNGPLMNQYADRVMPKDYRLAHEKSLESLRRMRRPRDTRHTGPSCMFRTLHEAGFSWLGAETMYSTMEPLMGFLRGTAKAYGMKTYGVHHAVQWSSSPQESPARYRRYRIALYASYLLGATDINTEEGLWHLEEYYEHHHRFSPACLAHLKEQRDFYRYVSTHSRTGEFLSPAAFLHGRDDGVVFFGKSKTWGVRNAKTVAEDSWDLISTVYPRANPQKAVYRHACPENEAQGYHSGTPLGNLDAVPAEADLKTLRDYRALILLGYNRSTAEDAEKLLAYVKRGGRLLLTRAHLTVTTDFASVDAGDLRYEENALMLSDGLPVFASDTVNGLTVSVAKNAKKPTEILKTTDSGAPLLLRYHIGKGEILLFNVKEYPSASAIRPLYEEAITDLLRTVNAEEPVYAETGDDVEFAVYLQKDGSRHVYFLAVDWYNDPEALRSATLRVGEDRYTLSLPFGALTKCVTNGSVAAWTESENGEVLAVTENTVSVQGTGTITFSVARNGSVTKQTVDLSSLGGFATLLAE